MLLAVVALCAFPGQTPLGLVGRVLLETEERPGRANTNEPTHLYSLHYQFDRVVFFPDPDESRAGPLDSIRKWTSEINACMSMTEYLEDGMRLADELSRLSGMPISIEAPCTPVDAYGIFIAIAERTRLAALVAEQGWPGAFEKAECLAFPADQGGVIRSSYIAIPYGSPIVQHCIVHELMHSLGLPGHAQVAGQSIMGLGSPPLTELPLNDKIIVRTLYDPRITPGMPRLEALAVAREVIAELLEDIEREGVEALYQLPASP